MSHPISLSDVRRRRLASGQMSRENRFAGRPVRVIPVTDKPGFVAWWAALLRRRCADAATVAQTFGCTEQAARYWLDEFSCPMGHYVDLALALWPEDFVARRAPDLPRAA